MIFSMSNNLINYSYRLCYSWKEMEDIEFKRKLELILGNLYKIDREVKKYFRGKNGAVKEENCVTESYSQYSINCPTNVYEKADGK